MQVSVSRGGGSFGVAGTVQLPDSLAEPLGMSASTTITLAANLGGGNSCFFLDLDAPDGANAIEIGDGIVEAQHAQIAIAPTGCTIGSGDGAFELAPGISLVFDGALLGTPVALDATIQTAPELSLIHI